MPITPYTGPFGRQQLLHLLRRSLVGVTPADIAHFEGMTLNQVVDQLLTFSTAADPPLKTYWVNSGGNPNPGGVDPLVPFGSTWVDTPRDMNASPNVAPYRNHSFLNWWVGNLLTQDRNLREKLVLFWSNTVVTQVWGVQDPAANYLYNKLLRDNCLGNYRQLMYDVTLHPAMLIYLNGFLNQVGAADENYGRELMELFTLGQGSGYTEADVQAAARVLTGFTVKYFVGTTPAIIYVQYYPSDHDTGSKQFSAFFNNTVIQGQTGPNGGMNEINQLLDMIFQKHEVSRHVCRELYRFFVHSDINATVESEVIEPLAQLFRDHNGSPDQMKHVVRALFTSARFFSNDVRSCMVKSPIDLVLGNLRTLGMPMPSAAQAEGRYHIWGTIWNSLETCDQPVGAPPDVAGWPAYWMQPAYDMAWLNTSTFRLRRTTVLGHINNGLSTPNTLYDAGSRNLQMAINFVQLAQQFNNPADPNSLVDQACELMFAVPVSSTVKTHLKTVHLLGGQAMDSYWTNAYNAYVNNPEIPDPVAQSVPVKLKALFADLTEAAEFQLH